MLEMYTLFTIATSLLFCIHIHEDRHLLITFMNLEILAVMVNSEEVLQDEELDTQRAANFETQPNQSCDLNQLPRYW